jgi:hypothetical protein
VVWLAMRWSVRRRLSTGSYSSRWYGAYRQYGIFTSRTNERIAVIDLDGTMMVD